MKDEKISTSNPTPSEVQPAKSNIITMSKYSTALIFKAQNLRQFDKILILVSQTYNLGMHNATKLETFKDIY